MDHVQLEPTVLGEDNMTPMAMISNDSNNNKTKYIEILFNLITEPVLKMVIKLLNFSTTEMTSDIFTKELDPKPSTNLRTKLLSTLAVCNSSLYNS